MQLKSLFIPINVSFNTQIALFKNDGICDIYEVICVRQWPSEQKNLSKCFGAADFSYHTFWSYNGTDRSTYRPKQSKKCEYLFTVSGICLVSLMVSIAVGVQWQSKYPLLNIVNSSAKRDTSPRVHGIFYKCDIWTNKAFLYLNDFSD